MHHLFETDISISTFEHIQGYYPTKPLNSSLLQWYTYMKVNEMQSKRKHIDTTNLWYVSKPAESEYECHDGVGYKMQQVMYHWCIIDVKVTHINDRFRVDPISSTTPAHVIIFI